MAKHLQSALRWIAREFEDRFVDDIGEELPREDGGDNQPFAPRELGDIINRAIELLNEQKATIEQIKLNILNLIDSEYDLAHGSEIRKFLKEVCNG